MLTLKAEITEMSVHEANAILRAIIDRFGSDIVEEQLKRRVVEMERVSSVKTYYLMPDREE